MAIRNLYRQARPFRYLGWGLFGLALLALPDSQISASQRVAGLLLAIAGMGVLDALRGLTTVALGGGFGDCQVKRLQQIELGLVPGLLLLLQFPLALVVAVVGALVNANVALGGTRALAQALVLCSLSLALAWLCGGQPAALAPDATLWMAAAVLLLVFTVALAEIGFRLTQKLDDHRRQWQERVAVLQPFVPHGLADRTPEQERRWMTVVMIDLVEFSARSSPLPPEVVGTVLDDLLDAVVSRANQTEGTLDKFMGDGALLFFASDARAGEAAHRSASVCNALRFVRQLLSEMPLLNSRWQGYGVSEALQIRAGVASGYCSLGQWGRSDVRAYTMIGSCVGLAERLQSVSQPESFALCPVSARLLLEEQPPATRPELHMPSEFELLLGGDALSFSSSACELKGFARMRVYRPSDKVHAPTM